MQNGLTEENVPEILDQLSQHPISFGKAADGSSKVYVGDVDITHPIRDNQVTNNVSWVKRLFQKYVKNSFHNNSVLLQEGGIIMDGRDIGTVVLPDAELKIFMILLLMNVQNVVIRKILKKVFLADLRDT